MPANEKDGRMNEENPTTIDDLIRRHQNDQGSEATTQGARSMAIYFHALRQAGIEYEMAKELTLEYQRGIIDLMIERDANT